MLGFISFCNTLYLNNSFSQFYSFPHGIIINFWYVNTYAVCLLNVYTFNTADTNHRCLRYYSFSAPIICAVRIWVDTQNLYQLAIVHHLPDYNMFNLLRTLLVTIIILYSYLITLNVPWADSYGHNIFAHSREVSIQGNYTKKRSFSNAFYLL